MKNFVDEQERGKVANDVVMNFFRLAGLGFGKM
jgi:hypothetical protein